MAWNEKKTQYIVQCMVIGYAHLWLTFRNAPRPGLRVPHAERHFRVAGRQASESELLLIPSC